MTGTTETDEAAGRERVSIPANAFYLPSPVVLLSTVDADGEVDVSAMSAVGVVCLDPPVIAVGIKARRRTYRNIRRTGTFVVNLPLDEDLAACASIQAGLRSGQDQLVFGRNENALHAFRDTLARRVADAAGRPEVGVGVG